VYVISFLHVFCIQVEALVCTMNITPRKVYCACCYCTGAMNWRQSYWHGGTICTGAMNWRHSYWRHSKQLVGVAMHEYECVCMCVCVCERERERESVCVCKVGSIQLSAWPRDARSKFPVCVSTRLCQIRSRVVKTIRNLCGYFGNVRERHIFSVV
jgi:hypothetical protein